MRAAASLAVASLLRAPTRTVTRILVLAASVGLLGAMLLFIGNSLRAQSAATIRSVALDWQGPVGSYGAAQNVAAGVAQQHGVLQASAAATAPFSGVSHTGAAGVSTAGTGSILAVPSGYDQHFSVYRFLQGGLVPGQIVLDRSCRRRYRRKSATRSRSPRDPGHARARSRSQASR
jgi:hypothetical protein